MAVSLAILSLAAACGGDRSETAIDASPTAGATTATASANEVAPPGARLARNGDRVQVHYTGSLDDGSVFDSSAGREPLRFTVGVGDVIRGFDDAVRGLAIGESVTVRIEPADAYGERSEDAILEFPLDQASAGLSPGDRVVLANGAAAVVLAVSDTIVRIDANHALAGKALTFEIELVAIE